ncbi:hypothetical protein BH11PSE8_BH11PSE8_20740 [soil metagenome]
MTAGGGAEAAAFAQVARRLSLFAQALADRPITVRALALPRAHWLGREGNGTGTGTGTGEGEGEGVGEAATVELPLLAGSPQALDEWRVRIVRQALGPNDGGRRPTLHQRPILWRRVFAILDAGRVDAVIAVRFPGAREALDRSRAESLRGRGGLRWHRPKAATIEALLQFSLGAERAALIQDDPANRLHRVLDRARDAMEASCPVPEVRQAVDEICTLLGAEDSRRVAVAQVLALERIESMLPEALEAPVSHITSDRTAPAGTDGDSDALDPVADHTSRFRHGAGLVSGGAAGADDPASDEPDPSLDHREAPPDTARQQAAPPDCLGQQTYDEWDHHAQRYRLDWTCVREHRLIGVDARFLSGLRLRHAAVARQIRRRFGALRPQARVRLRRSADGDEIDLDSAIEQRVERLAGHCGDDRAYTAHKAERRDVCVAFLVDMSGSTGFQLPAPASGTPAEVGEDDGYFYGGFSRPAPSPPRRRVIDVAKDAIGLMCDGAEVLGDRHAVFGYSGDGRLQVDIHVAKRFDEVWSAHCAAAIGAMQPQRATRTGAAVRHATAALSREQSGTRLLIVLTDGYPQDRDYGPDPDDIAYGLHDTARAFEEAERAGVTAFCVTVDPAGHDYLGTMCPENRYLVIDEVEALPEQLAKLYSEASWRLRRRA